jgi:hypothetical protein
MVTGLGLGNDIGPAGAEAVLRALQATSLLISVDMRSACSAVGGVVADRRLDNPIDKVLLKRVDDRVSELRSLHCAFLFFLVSLFVCFSHHRAARRRPSGPPLSPTFS